MLAHQIPLSIIPNLSLSAPFANIANEFQQIQQKIVSSASKYFEVKGDLILFKNTDEMGGHIQELLATLSRASQTTVKTLNQCAATFRSMDDSALLAYVLLKFLDLRQNDPSTMQLLGLLAAATPLQITHLIDTMLRTLATTIQKKSQDIVDYDKSRTKTRFYLYMALKDNSFNWKTGKFQAVGISLGSRFANWYKLNPMVSKAKSGIHGVVSSTFAAALTRAGVPSPAVTATANMLASMIVEGDKA